MSDDTDADADDAEPTERSTAPQSEYTTGQVAFGFVVALVGVAITFGIPLAFL